MAAQKRFLSGKIPFLLAVWLLSLSAAAQERIRCRAPLPPIQKNVSCANARGLAGQLSDVPETKHGLALLIEFSDVAFTMDNPQTYYEAFFNEEGFNVDGNEGSVRDYYWAQSHERFDVNFDVCGPFKLSRSYAYYGQNVPDGSDLHPAEMIQEALDMLFAEDPGRDFSRYDWDGDGYANIVFAQYAGRGENYLRARPSLMWPHMFTFTLQKEYYNDGVGPKSVGGTVFDTYACSCELHGSTGTKIDGVGVACHEFMHALGVPDTYALKKNVCKPLEDYDLMDTGNYMNECHTPGSLSAYHKLLLGWVDPVEISSPCKVAAMMSTISSSEVYVLYNETDRNECFVLENRQKISWDRYLPASCFTVTHVDYNLEDWAKKHVNVDPNHPRMSLVESADWESLPLFNTPPEVLPLAIAGVKSTGQYISFEVKKEGTDVNELPEISSEEGAERYDLLGRKIPSGQRPRGWYIEGGKLRLPGK